MEDFFVSANLLDIGFSGELVIGGDCPKTIAT